MIAPCVLAKVVVWLDVGFFLEKKKNVNKDCDCSCCGGGCVIVVHKQNRFTERSRENGINERIK